MNKVLLVGKLTRDPEMRALADGRMVTQFSVATDNAPSEIISPTAAKTEYHNVVTWDHLAEQAGRYLIKGGLVAIEGCLQTRTWDDDRGLRHWKTEIVATKVEMLSGRDRAKFTEAVNV